jgi:hypothetical protein
VSSANDLECMVSEAPVYQMTIGSVNLGISPSFLSFSVLLCGVFGFISPVRKLV